MRNKPLYKVILWCLLIFLLFLLSKLSAVLTKLAYIPIDDFVRHWAAGKLFLSHDDPYQPPNPNPTRPGDWSKRPI
jgi:hypothetical protein